MPPDAIVLHWAASALLDGEPLDYVGSEGRAQSHPDFLNPTYSPTLASAITPSDR